MLTPQLIETSAQGFMRVVTQNLNWGGGPDAPGCPGESRLTHLVPLLANTAADVLVLTEYKAGDLGRELAATLAGHGYPHLILPEQSGRSLGVAIAASSPLQRIEMPVPPQIDCEPWRAIGARCQGVDIFGLYFPLGPAKVCFWDWVIANANPLRDTTAVLIGDFNTGLAQVDEAQNTFDCQAQHQALADAGFTDAWRSAYPRGRDYTWYSSGGNGFRLDYVWVSPKLAGRVKRVWHDHETRLLCASDHSSVGIDLTVVCRSEQDPGVVSDTLETDAFSTDKCVNNVFTLADYEIGEDRFSAAWGYVLWREPRLAQRVAELLCGSRTDLRPEVVDVSDHPVYENCVVKPDFRIECRDFDILVEHKLDALLHDRQLESYLAIEVTKPTYLALIAPSWNVVPKEVLADARFLRPQYRDHFRWRDFFEVFRAADGPLAQEFGEHMASLGLAPFEVDFVEDLFDNYGEKAIKFERLLKTAARAAFDLEKPGCFVKGTSSGRALEIRNPSEELTLIYLAASRASNLLQPSGGPALEVWVYRSGPETRNLDSCNLKTVQRDLHVLCHRLVKPRQLGAATCHVAYAASLHDLLHRDSDEAILRLTDILTLVRRETEVGP